MPEVPTEAWLRSKSHTKWAAAMSHCQHPAGLCGDDGYCHYSNCFKIDELRKELEAVMLRARRIRCQIENLENL